LAQRPQQRAQQQHTGGTPGPRQFIIFDNMPKMNTRPMRQNLSEKEAYWIENLQPIAGNDLQVVPAPLFPLTLVPGKTVARQFSTSLLSDPTNPNSSLIDYIIYFATDGSATAARADNGAAVVFAPPGTFSTTPDLTTYSDSMVLIADPIAGYSSWDGAILTTNINGIACTTVAVFGGRAWLAHRRLLIWSDTLSPTTFDPTHAAGSTSVTDADLVHEITALRSLNNYLYIFGDQSVKFIGNISVTTPSVGASTTEFQIVTLASDIGCPFPMSIQSYNRIVVFCNLHGVYAIVGASVQKASDDLDGIFKRVDFFQEPCGAVTDINNIHVYCLLLRYQDPINFAVFGVQPQGQAFERSIIAVLQSRDWYLLNQGLGLISIVSLPLAETNEVSLFGSSGSDVTQLVINDNAPVTYILKTPLTAHGNIIVNKRAIRAGVALAASEPQTVTMLIESENKINEYTLKAAKPIIWRNAQHEIITFFSGPTPIAANAPLPPPGVTPLQSNASILFPTVPQTVAFNASGTLGMAFSSTVSGNITGIRVYEFPTDTIGGLAAIWTTGGVPLTSTAYPGGGGWITVTLGTPVAITAGTTYVVGFLPSNKTYYHSDLLPVTTAPLTAIQSQQATAGFTFPANVILPARWFGVDIVFDAGATPPTPPGPPGPPTPPPQPPVLGEIQFMLGPGFTVPYRSVESYGHVVGATLFGTTSNLAINAVMIEYIDADLWSDLPSLPTQHGGPP